MIEYYYQPKIQIIIVYRKMDKSQRQRDKRQKHQRQQDQPLNNNNTIILNKHQLQQQNLHHNSNNQTNTNINNSNNNNPNKQQQLTTSNKILSTIKRLFISQPNTQPQINRSLISNTYYSLLQIIHTVLLFAVFNKSNSSTYSIAQSAIGGYFFMVYLIPRLSKKHSIFQVTFILYAIGTIAAGLVLIILFKYFYVFTFYCHEIEQYYQKKQISQYISKSICQTVNNMYISQIIVEIFILLLRLVYLFWCFRAYMVARDKYQQQEKKKRRKDRYNQLLLKRNMYNQKRRI